MKTSPSLTLAGLAIATSLALTPNAEAMPLARADTGIAPLIEPIAAVRRTTVHRGPAGGAVRHSTVVRTGPGVRRGAVVVAPRPVVVGGWARPYRWAPGGAIAAGAAIGFVTAAAVAASVPRAPQPGLCWYYTNPSRTAGFWDNCP
jgi:hypothetical protein